MRYRQMLTQFMVTAGLLVALQACDANEPSEQANAPAGEAAAPATTGGETAVAGASGSTGAGATTAGEGAGAAPGASGADAGAGATGPAGGAEAGAAGPGGDPAASTSNSAAGTTTGNAQAQAGATPSPGSAGVAAERAVETTAGTGAPGATEPAGAAIAQKGGQVAGKAASTTDSAYWTDVARYLGGLPVTPGGSLDALSKRPESVNHRAYFDRAWEKKQARLLTDLKGWISTEFPEVHASSRNVFYPFSGPDFLTVHTLMPNGASYVLFGLEPEGQLPDVRQIPPARLKGNLSVLQNSLADIMVLSFFKTIDMASDFRAAELDGAAPILLAFLARTGNEVLSIEPVKIDRSGQAVAYTEKIKQDPADAVVTGVRIHFRKPGGKAQALSYYSVDIADGSLTKKPAFEKYLRDLAPASTYVKSASYLMHKAYFSKIRSLILDISDFVLQDDSGMPVKFFDPKVWDVRLYGRYTGTIPLFARHKQPVLEKMYRDKENVRPLAFGIGYKFQPGTSNLQAATKKPMARQP